MIEEHLIRVRAHSIWESEGRPSGRADDHWALASAQLAKETKRAPGSAPRKAAAAAVAAEPRVKSATTARKPRTSATS